MKRQTKNADVGRLCSLCVWCFAAMYSLQCFVLSPLYFSLYSNVELYDTVLPVIVQYAGIAVELIAISVLYGAMIYGVFKFGQNSVRSFIGVFAAATGLKYLANVIITWITYGIIPRTWIWDVANVVFYTALEMLQLWVVVTVIKAVMGREGSCELPFGSVWDKGNKLMRSAMACGIITVAFKVFGRLCDDAWAIITSGLPERPITYLLMLVSYVSTALLGVVCYGVAVAAMGWIHSHSTSR
ncbi:MAG: hypothetical protein IJC64_03925 [Clostridia bacterium]|nr:hypothetical protein [Clostridia bacterium]